MVVTNPGFSSKQKKSYFAWLIEGETDGLSEALGLWLAEGLNDIEADGLNEILAEILALGL